MNRILIVSNAFSGGGAEAVARLMVQELDGATCILFENDAEIVVPGVRVLVASTKYNGGFLFTLLVNFKRLVFIQWVKIWLRPTVTISHLEGPNIANMLTVCGGRRVLFVHNRISENYSGNSFRDLMKRGLAGILYRHAEKVIGVSPGICKELCGFLKVESQKVLFGPNPIDRLSILERSNQRYGDYRDNIVEGNYLIIIASLSRQKNIEFSLYVFKRLIKDYPQFNNLKLVILGGGEMQDGLYVLCKELSLVVFDITGQSYTGTENVYFLGFQSNPYRLLSRGKLLVMTSRWEGLPIALLEAMALGVPGVISNCSDGIRKAWQVESCETYQQKLPTIQWTSFGALISGVESHEETISVWVAAIRRLLENETLYDQCSRASSVRSKDFDIKRILDFWKLKLFVQD